MLPNFGKLWYVTTQVWKIMVCHDIFLSIFCYTNFSWCNVIQQIKKLSPKSV